MTVIQQYTKKDGSKAYQFNVYLGIDPNTGKKKRTTRRGFRTRKEANTALAKLLTELETRSVSTINNLTFNEVFEMWFADHSKEVKITTKKAIASKFKVRILPKFGHLKINNITRSYCQEVINEWAKELRAFNDYKIQTNLVFNYALKMELLQQNPMALVTLPKQQKDLLYDDDTEKENFLTKEELQLFLATVYEEFDFKTFMIFRLLAFTGGRKGEVLALHWSDIDFANKKISFKKTVVEIEGDQLLLPPKTPASRRFISVDEGTLVFLEKWRTEQAEAYEALHMKIEKDIGQPLFTRYSKEESKMKYLRLATLNDKLAAFFKKHPNFNPITIHGFRHTHASLLFEAGAGIKDVQVRLGHSDIQTTLNVYTHVTNSAKEKVAHLFENFMDF